MENKPPPISILLQELKRQAAEITRLRALLAEERAKNRKTNRETAEPPEREDTGTTDVSLPAVSPEIAARFFSFFRGRADVYSRRVTRKDGTAAYFPVCRNFWKYGVCPRCTGQSTVKCAECPAREWEPVTKRALMQHLNGGEAKSGQIIGIYPMLADNTCRFLAFDFDNHNGDIPNWKEEVDALRSICRHNSVPALVERSRSGEGAHIWLFFEQAIPARQARRFGSALLTKGAESVNQRSFVSYDRMLPAQDELPEGKIGNLIALPLQGCALRESNSAFVDDNWTPYPDQLATLWNTGKIASSFIDKKISEWTPDGLLGPLSTLKKGEETSSADEKPWQANRFILKPQDAGQPVTIVRSNMIWVDKTGLAPRFLNYLRRMAAFSNPNFYRNRGLGLSTAGIPSIVACHDETDKYIGLPRGKFGDLEGTLRAANVPFSTQDLRACGTPVKVGFQGELYPIQKEAADAILRHDNGILCAATAFGKTAVGAYLVAHRGVSTLILVHNREILKNWIEDFHKFLRINEEAPTYLTGSGRERKRKSPIGKLYASHDSLTGIIDIAMVSSLKEDDPRLESYGLVIMDECHHAAAANTERIIQKIKAKYLYGLTATPKRDDGMEQKVYMQFGGILYRFTARQRAEMQNVQHLVCPRFTQMAQLGEAWKIHDAYKAITRDSERNELIISDIRQAVSQGHTPLVLTKFRDHAELLAHRLEGAATHIVLLLGGKSTKERDAVRARLHGILDDETAILIATGQYVGEGFNFPRLDTLMLTTPVAWEGNVEQYAGRLHRDFEGKHTVCIYDYIDIRVPVLERMYHKRLRTYRKIGYNLYPFTAPAQRMEPAGIMGGTEYGPHLERDCLEAAHEVVICSPGINAVKTRWIAALARQIAHRGVRTSIITLSPCSYPADYQAQAASLHDTLMRQGIHLSTAADLHEHIAVIDRNIVWYGSANILSKDREQDSLIRICDSKTANNLYMYLHDMLAPSRAGEQPLLPLEG